MTYDSSFRNLACLRQLCDTDLSVCVSTSHNVRYESVLATHTHTHIYIYIYIYIYHVHFTIGVMLLNESYRSTTNRTLMLFTNI